MELIRRTSALILMLIMISGIFAGCAQESFSSDGKTGLYINEVVSSNAYSLVDPELGSPDWIELYNGTASAISLRDYALSDNINQPSKWTFPDITIEPGEYLVLYAAQVPEDSTDKDHLCTGFKLSRDGETLIFSAPDGSLVQELQIPELFTDISWGRDEDGQYRYFGVPTPGKTNGDGGVDSIEEAMRTFEPGAISINEIMTENRSILSDSDGDFSGWVEIINTHTQELSLEGYCLTDNASSSMKWKLPEVSLDAGECLVIFLSGKDRASGELHTNFKLGRQENGLWLINPAGTLEDMVQWQTAPPADFSLGRDSGGTFKYFGAPTPGEPNADYGLEALEYSEVELPEGVRLNEFLISNRYSKMDADGDRSAWAEIYNASSEAVSLKSFSISDDKNDPVKWRFPDIALEAGEHLVVFLSGKDRSVAGEELHAGFSLSRNDSELMLTNLETMECETIDLPDELMDNVSYGRALDDPARWEHFAQPTPGHENTTKGFEDILSVTAIDRQSVWINEVSAVSEAKSGKKDWIEIANGGSETVNLAGYFLSDSTNNPYKWEIPDISISPGSYAVIYASGKPSLQTESVAGFGLSAAGDTLMLSSPKGYMLDVFETGVLRPGFSSGRAYGDESGERVFFNNPTPGQTNGGDTVTKYAAQPSFSQPGGYAEGTVELEIISETPGAAIYYTLNGARPTTSSQLYTAPIEISSSTTVKAIAVADNMLSSEMAVSTYLFEEKHTVPVMCLSADPAEFTRIYSVTQIMVKLEREGYVEYYEDDGKLGVAFPAGLRVAGASTRTARQKSLNLNLRGGYGQSEVTYPFFKDFEHVTFSSLRLRNSGQDRNYARLRDAYCALASRDMNIDYAEYRLVAVYVNGEYYGLYDLRENQKDDYYAYRHGTTDDNIERIKRNQYALSGSSREIQAVRAFARSKNLNDEALYAEFCEMVDADSMMDYLVAQTFFGNHDMFNQKYGRAIDYTFKWRLLFFDLDLAMKHKNINLLRSYFNPAGVPSADGTLTNMDLQCGLLKNDGWKEAFIERYAYHLNNTYTKEKLLALLEEMVAEMEPEMQRHINKWGSPSSVSAWLRNVDEVRDFLTDRTQIAKQHLKSFFNLSTERYNELFPNG